MNPKIARVKVSAIVHATESPDKVISAMQGIVPEEEGRMERRKASGHYGNEIQIVQMVISNRSPAESFLRHFWRRLSLIDRTEMIDNISAYLDESGHLHFRADKQEAVNGRIVLGQMEPIRIEISFDLQGIPTEGVKTLIGKRLEALAF